VINTVHINNVSSRESQAVVHVDIVMAFACVYSIM
jgi:hypothetical protein